MKVIAVNIPPINKCHMQLQKSELDDETRALRFVERFEEYDADIIFFVEQYGPVFNKIKKDLNQAYNFYYPKGFKPSKKSYSGVVAAVKKGVCVQHDNGSAIALTKLQARFLGLTIKGEYYAGVHFPLGKRKKEFVDKVNSFVANKKPKLLIGDFNPSKGTKIQYEGYRDVLDDRNTALFKTKLDYVFVPIEVGTNEFIFDASVFDPNSDLFASDHAIVGVVFK